MNKNGIDEQPVTVGNLLLQHEKLIESARQKIDLHKFVMAQQHCDEALELAKKACELSRQSSNPEDKSPVISEPVNFKEKKASALMLRGFCFKSRNLPNRALESYKTGLEILEQDSDSCVKASLLNNIGIIYKNLGRYEEAQENYFKSLKIRENMNEEKLQANVLNNIAVVFDLCQNYESAFNNYEKSLDLRRKINDNVATAASLNNLGNHFYNQKNYDRALKYYLESKKLKQEIGDNSGLAYTYNNIGAVYRLQDNLKEALSYHRAAYNIKKDLNDERGMISSQINIANDLSYMKNYDEAIEILNTLFSALKEDDIMQKINCYKLYASIYERQEQYKLAYETYQKYSELQQKLDITKANNKALEMETRFKIDQKEKETEISRLKNVELVKANRDIRRINVELNEHREHFKLINQILRHDVLNNLTVTKSAFKIFDNTGDKQYIQEGLNKIDNSVILIKRMRELEHFIAERKGLSVYDLAVVLDEVKAEFPEMDIQITGRMRILADQSIHSLFSNIISNAIRHGKTDKIQIKVESHKHWCEVEIADFGKGIGDSIKEKIFEKGFKSGETAHTGMGLYIVKKTMLGYGGDIYCLDNQPRGAKFILTFRRVN